jgi:hypothetical protein
LDGVFRETYSVRGSHDGHNNPCFHGNNIFIIVEWKGWSYSLFLGTGSMRASIALEVVDKLIFLVYRCHYEEEERSTETEMGTTIYKPQVKKRMNGATIKINIPFSRT